MVSDKGLKLDIIEYRFGGAGAQDGAQYGPENLSKCCFTDPTGKSERYTTTLQEVLNRKGFSISRYQPVPRMATHYDSLLDAGMVTRVSLKSGEVKTGLNLKGETVYKLGLLDETTYQKYDAILGEHGFVERLELTKSKDHNQIESKPPQLRVTDGFYYPPGIKNYFAVKAATEHLAASVCKSTLAPLFGDQNLAPPLIVGGDHSQGLGTAVGSRLSALVQALLSEEAAEQIPLRLEAGESREALLMPVLNKAKYLHQLAPTEYEQILSATKALAEAVRELIDFELFEQVKNQTLFNLALQTTEKSATETVDEHSARIATTMDELRQAYLANGNDRGRLSLTDLIDFKATLHEIWFDAHGDWNDEVTSVSKHSHGMPLAALSGFGVFATLLGTEFLEFDPRNTHTIGTRDTDTDERLLMRRVGVDISRMKEVSDAAKRLEGVDSYGEITAYGKTFGLRYLFDEKLQEIRESTLQRTGREPQLILSYDGDGIHATEFTSTGTPVGRGGPKGEHALEAVRGIFNEYQVLATDLSEFNPLLRMDNNKNLSAVDRQSLEMIHEREDGTVGATRDLTIALAESIYHGNRGEIPDREKWLMLDKVS